MVKKETTNDKNKKKNKQKLDILEYPFCIFHSFFEVFIFMYARNIKSEIKNKDILQNVCIFRSLQSTKLERS